jgi:hypothetical protein
METNKPQQTEFNNFTDLLYDVIFEETSNYLSDCVGSNEWGEELHEAHGIIMYNALTALAKKMNVIKE